MPQGVQLFDATANLVVDTNSFLVKTGIVDIGAITSNGSANIAAIQALGGTVVPLVDAGINRVAPIVSISGSTLSWSDRGGGVNAFLRVEIQ